MNKQYDIYSSTYYKQSNTTEKYKSDDAINTPSIRTDNSDDTSSPEKTNLNTENFYSSNKSTSGYINYSSDDIICTQNFNTSGLYSYKLGNEIACIYSSNKVEFEIKDTDCEIRADLSIIEKNITLLWGEVFDNCKNPVNGAFVTLLTPTMVRGYLQHIQVANTLTNNLGYFQFYLPFTEKKTKYQIIIGEKF